MRVLAVAGDAGGARALVPVVEGLRRTGAVVSCHAYGAALPLWKQRGLDPSPERPEVIGDHLLLGTSVAGEAWELELIGAARKRGVRSVSVLDFWGHYKERFRLAQREVLPDAIAIMDERARREMLAQGFSPEILHVTGQPAFDILDECDTPAAREAARELVGRRLGSGSDVRSVVYVSQPLARLFGHERLGFVEGDVLTAITSSLAEIVERRQARAGLLVKRHPREVGTQVLGPSSPSPRLTVQVIPDDDPTDARVWVVGCDLVVGMSSVLLMEACLLRQPVVSFQPGLREPDTLPSNAMGWSRGVYDRAELQRALESELFDPEIRSERRRQLAAIERPRGATERVIALLGERSA